MSWLEPLLHWLAVHTGTLNEPGPYYGFWSGFGSDLGELAIIGGLIGVFRKHNCHTSGCWRIGRHVVDGSPWCNRHHQGARGVPAPPPPPDPVLARLSALSEDISGLADAIRVSVLDRRAADGPVNGGAGSNPVKSEGLPADGLVVPPPAVKRTRAKAGM